jgi:hypothetical protein
VVHADVLGLSSPADVSVQRFQHADARHHGRAVEFDNQKQGFYVHPENANEVFKTLQKIRHTLAHGGQISSVIDDLPCSQEEALNKLAFVTWSAISMMFNKADPNPAAPLDFGLVENFARRKIERRHVVVGMLGGDPENPDIKAFPVDLALAATLEMILCPTAPPALADPAAHRCPLIEVI